MPVEADAELVQHLKCVLRCNTELVADIGYGYSSPYILLVCLKSNEYHVMRHSIGYQPAVSTLGKLVLGLGGKLGVAIDLSHYFLIGSNYWSF